MQNKNMYLSQYHLEYCICKNIEYVSYLQHEFRFAQTLCINDMLARSHGTLWEGGD